MVSSLSAILPAPVTPVASGGLAAFSGEARLGNLPKTSIAPSIAAPDLQSQNRGQGQDQRAPTAETPSTPVSLAIPGNAPVSSLSIGGTTSFLAQLIAQSAQASFNEDGSLPPILDFESFQVANPVKYLPSNAFAPAPPTSREQYEPAQTASLPSVHPAVADAIGAARATISQSASLATLLAEKPLPALVANRTVAVERVSAKITPLGASAPSLVLPRGVDAYAASRDRTKNLEPDAPELQVAV